MTFFDELKRRNVFRVAAAYAVVAWLLIQLADILLGNFGAPAWVFKSVVVLLLVGFPVALVLSWAYELTPDGVRRSDDVASARTVRQSARPMNRVILVALVSVIALMAVERLRFAGDAKLAAVGNTGGDRAAPSRPESGVVSAKSVAVLPFADLSQNADQAWFADGLTEEILNALTRVGELKVTARTSSFQFRGENRDIRGIADTLGVAHIVEGSVRRVGDRLRITAQLIRAADGFHLWSETYNGTADDLLEVQRDVSEQIAATLDVLLDDARRARMFGSGTRNVAAFEQFQRGSELMRAAHGSGAAMFSGLADANTHFERALALEPRYWQAALLHSDRYAHVILDGMPADGVTQQQAIERLRADMALAAATATDPILRAVAQVNGDFFSTSWHRMPALLREIGTAPDSMLPSTDAALWLHELQLLSGDVDGARRLALHWRGSDPLYVSAWNYVASSEVHAGNLAGARAVIEEARSRTGDHRWLRDNELLIAILAREREQVMRLLQLPSERDWYPAYLAAVRGDYDAARSLAASLDRQNDWPQEDLLLVYHEIGDRERARALARRIDALPAGAAIFGRLLALHANALHFDLADTPNFVARLREAGIDPARFPVMPRLSTGEPARR